MPEDRTPRILAGFRLQRTTTRLLSILSKGTNFTSPDTICMRPQMHSILTLLKVYSAAVHPASCLQSAPVHWPGGFVGASDWQQATGSI